MVFVYSKLVYTLLDVIRIYLKNNYIQKEVKIGIFHAISGESQSDWDGWTVFFMWEEDKKTKYWRDVFIVDTT